MLSLRAEAAPAAIVHAALAHPGVRSLNEDAVYADPERGLYLVVDGSGGTGCGDRASAMVLEALGAMPLAPEEALREANRRIHEASRQEPGHSRMGATAALAEIRDGWATIYHVGEVRAYLIRDAGLVALTEDHTLAAQLVKLRQLSPEAAMAHPARKSLTRHLGKEPALRLERLDLPLVAGDALLLCTDGLYASLSPEDLVGLAEGDLDDMGARLDAAFRRALANGCQDNLGAVLLRVPTSAEPASGGAIGVSSRLRQLLDALLVSPFPGAELRAYAQDLSGLLVEATSAARATLVEAGHEGWTSLGACTRDDLPALLPGPGHAAVLDEAMASRAPVAALDGTVAVPIPGEGGLAFLVEPSAGAGLAVGALAPCIELAAWYRPLARVARLRELECESDPTAARDTRR